MDALDDSGMPNPIQKYYLLKIAAFGQCLISIIEQGQKFKENPFTQRFLQNHQRDSKKILVEIKKSLQYVNMRNPQILTQTFLKNLNEFWHPITNFYPC